MNDFIEMVCDFLAAGRAYSGATFSYAGERTWWLKERENGCKAMNEKNKKMLDIIFVELEIAENPALARLTNTPEYLIKHGFLQEVWRANS